MVFLRAFFGAVLIAAVPIARSEVFFDITWLMTLGEIKKRYPNATFARVRPAWEQPDEAFYLLTGNGLPGKVYILFDDPRPGAKEQLAKVSPQAAPDSKEVWERIRDRTDDDALMTNWVRWIPPRTIPISRYQSKYGPATCSLDANMSPICNWAKYSLQAQMSEDNKSVEFVTSGFTADEKKEALGLSKKK